jgi:hypothetical protein
VVGSIFASVYAARLADGAFGTLPGATLHEAQDSVGVAQAIGSRTPALASAMQDAFMAGLHTSCVVIGLLCVAGAVGAAFALPGRLRPTPSPEDAKVPAGTTATVPA